MATVFDSENPDRVVAATYTDAVTPRPVGATPLVRRISWGAVLAGAVLALVIQLSLSLLGLGIGLGTIDPLQEQNPMAGIGVGAAIWWVASMLIFLYLGATVASRLAGMPRPLDGLLHGLLTWSVVTLLTFYLLSTAVGRIIGGVTGVAGRALSGVGQGIAAVAPAAGDAIQNELQKQGINVQDLQREARTLLRQTGKPELDPNNLEAQARAAGRDAKTEATQSAENPQATDENLSSLFDRLTSRAENIGNAADRDAAVNVVMKRTGKSRAESEQIVDNWISTAQQAKAQLEATKKQLVQQARVTGDQVAEGLSKAALLAALGLGLGAAAAAIGGWLSVPKRAVGVDAPVA